MSKANKAIRETAVANKVYLYQIAEKLNCNDGNLSRKLRKELPEAEKNKILQIISEIAKEQKGEGANAEG